VAATAVPPGRLAAVRGDSRASTLRSRPDTAVRDKRANVLGGSAFKSGAIQRLLGKARMNRSVAEDERDRKASAQSRASDSLANVMLEASGADTRYRVWSDVSKSAGTQAATPMVEPTMRERDSAERDLLFATALPF
jgi:hypothetical protein